MALNKTKELNYYLVTIFATTYCIESYMNYDEFCIFCDDTKGLTKVELVGEGPYRKRAIPLHKVNDVLPTAIDSSLKKRVYKIEGEA